MPDHIPPRRTEIIIDDFSEPPSGLPLDPSTVRKYAPPPIYIIRTTSFRVDGSPMDDAKQWMISLASGRDLGPMGWEELIAELLINRVKRAPWMDVGLPVDLTEKNSLPLDHQFTQLMEAAPQSLYDVAAELAGIKLTTARIDREREAAVLASMVPPAFNRFNYVSDKIKDVATVVIGTAVALVVIAAIGGCVVLCLTVLGRIAFE